MGVTGAAGVGELAVRRLRRVRDVFVPNQNIPVAVSTDPRHASATDACALTAGEAVIRRLARHLEHRRHHGKERGSGEPEGHHHGARIRAALADEDHADPTAPCVLSIASVD